MDILKELQKQKKKELENGKVLELAENIYKTSKDDASRNDAYSILNVLRR